MSDSVADRHRAAEAQERVQSLKPNTIVERYMKGLDDRGDFLPKASTLLLAKIGGNDPVANVAAATRKLPAGGSAGDRLANAFEFLHSEEGKIYLNPSKIDDVTPPLKKLLARLGVPSGEVESLWTEHATATAGRTPGGLAHAVVGILTHHRGGRYLGVGGGGD